MNPSVNENCATSYDDDYDDDTNDRDPDNGTTYYADVDGDDFGDPGDPRVYCEPSGTAGRRRLRRHACGGQSGCGRTCTASYDDDCDGNATSRCAGQPPRR